MIVYTAMITRRRVCTCGKLLTCVTRIVSVASQTLAVVTLSVQRKLFKVTSNSILGPITTLNNVYSLFNFSSATLSGTADATYVPHLRNRSFLCLFSIASRTRTTSAYTLFNQFTSG